MLASISDTRAAARALLAPLSDQRHADAEDRGDMHLAALVRGEPELPGASFRDLVIDRQYVPRTLYREMT